MGMTYLRLVRCSDLLQDPFGDVIYVNNRRRRARKSRDLNTKSPRTEGKSKGKEVISELQARAVFTSSNFDKRMKNVPDLAYSNTDNITCS